MKLILSAVLISLTVQFTKAQNNTVTGSVQDENGRFLHFVFIGDSKYKNAVFSDSLGNFTIPIYADSKLLFECEGYQDTLVAGDKLGPTPQLVLKSSANIPVETINLSLHTVLTDSGLAIRQKPNVVGSRYMFGTFSQGFFFTNASDKRIYNRYFLFNYEKVTGLLLLTVDRKTVKEVVSDQVKSFTLYNNADQRFDFEIIPDINKTHFVQILATGGKYKICKLIKTKFVPADYEHVAMGQTAGHEYDEYVDDAGYYALDVQTNQLQKLALKKKSIRADFANDADKVEKFFTLNPGDIDDSYLQKLGNYLNE